LEVLPKFEKIYPTPEKKSFARAYIEKRRELQRLYEKALARLKEKRIEDILKSRF